jgi:hypothetical protein
MAALFLAAVAWAWLVRASERWGTLPHEPTLPMPGDELIPEPAMSATRAMVIDAPPEDVYPWFAQMGPGRAGWYSYDWIDNRGVESAREIMPDWVITEPGASMGGMAGIRFRVVDARPGSQLVLMVETRSPLSFTMGYRFEPWGEHATRVIVRVRGASGRGWWQDATIRHLLGPGDFVMVRRQLLGVKERAEQR